MKELLDPTISYWKQGCDDAKAGKPYNTALRHANGYDNGFYWGQHGKPRYDMDNRTYDATILGPEPEFFTEDPDHGFEDDMDDGHFPDAEENPYMEVIGFIEDLMESLPTNGLDRARTDEYRVNLLEVRDTLHRFRQAEMSSTAG